MAWTKVITTSDDSAYKNSNVPNQTLSISGQVVTLSNSGGSVTIPDLDTQDLSISGQTLSLTNGGSVTLPDLDTQNISISGNTITLVDGGTVDVSSATAVAANTAKETNVVQTTVSGTSGSTTGNAATVTNGVYTTSTIAVGKGGTGATATTGTGSNVLSTNPSFTGTVATAGLEVQGEPVLTEANVLNDISGNLSVAKGGTGATAKTGTGSNVLSISPTFTGTIGATSLTLSGNLTVSGTTTTLNTATLEVEDQLIKLANVASPTATTATGAGIQIEASATEADYPELKWIKAQGGGNTDGTGVANGLTGWQVSNMHTSNPVDLPIAVMEFSTNSTAPTGNAGGVGSFHFDSGNDSLYIRTS